MRKQAKRLHLHRETLLTLSYPCLRNAAGGTACETADLSMCGVCPSDPLICDTYYDCGYTADC